MANNDPKQNNGLALDLHGVEEKLEGLIRSTEDYYSVVHESLPVIDRNIELTNQETSLLINFFIDSEGSSQEGDAAGKDTFLMAESLQQIQDKFLEISDFLLNQDDINETLNLFLKGTQKDNSFQSFLSQIKDVADTLGDINDISLNAMIFSARLGEKGQGFGVISEHIHQVSSFVDKEFADINSQIQTLQNWQQQLNEDIEQIVNSQENATNNYLQQIDKIFSQVVESMQAVSEMLRNIMSNVNSSVSPFQELMAFIQRQDIVRQNIENTIKCLSLVREKQNEYSQLLRENEPDEKEILDHITFIKRGMELIEQLTSEASCALSDSLEDITSTTGELLQSLREVKEDSQQLTHYLAEGSMEQFEGSKLSMVDYTFSQVFSFMSDFLGLLKNVKDSTEKLTHDKTSFNNATSDIDASLKKITHHISPLSKIKVLARIELARMGEEDHAIGKNIEKVVEEVKGKIVANQEVFESLKISLNKNLDRFDHIIVNNQQQIDRAVEDVNTSLDQVKAANDIISQAVSALNKEIESLYQTISDVYSRLKGVEKIKESCQEINTEITDILDKAKTEKQRIFDHYQVQEWEEKNEELIELFNLFTGYLERMTAKGYLGEDELDEGSEEGELTLF